MASILLFHEEGRDRDALAAWLERNGYRVSCVSDAHDLRSRMEASEDSLVVCRVASGDTPPALPPDVPALLLGTPSTPIGSAGEALEEPYFLGDVAAALERLGRRSRSLPPVKEDGEPEASSLGDPGLVLRGLAHALNNPLAAASGWLQLLAADVGAEDPRSRALHQAQGELHRMEQQLQAVGLIGGRPGGLKAPLDLATLLRERARRLEEYDLPVTLRCDSPDLPMITGDPSELGLMLDLLLGSFGEERGRVGELHLDLRQEDDALALTIREDGGALSVTGLEEEDLGLLLRRVRHTRALGLALARALVRDRLGGSVSLVRLDDGNASLVLTFPIHRGLEGAAP